MSHTTFAEEQNFQVTYNGDYIATAVFTDLGHHDVSEFLYALDRDLKTARDEAVQCYINLRGENGEL